MCVCVRGRGGGVERQLAASDLRDSPILGVNKMNEQANEMVSLRPLSVTYLERHLVYNQTCTDFFQSVCNENYFYSGERDNHTLWPYRYSALEYLYQNIRSAIKGELQLYLLTPTVNDDVYGFRDQGPRDCLLSLQRMRLFSVHVARQRKLFASWHRIKWQPCVKR